MKNGNGLRAVFIILLINLVAFFLSGNLIVFISALIAWMIGRDIWIKNFNKREIKVEDKSLDIIVANFWFFAIFFEWNTFDKVQPDEPKIEKKYCKICYRPMVQEQIFRASCCHASEFPADDSAYTSQQVQYCAVCEDSPHIRKVTCLKGPGACPDTNCFYRKDC